MSLTAGARLGPYEVLSPLGAGGMREVYKARGRKLGREVAVKVLPARLSADREALSRFERWRRSRGKWQISSEGGRWPRWRRDGRELFYWKDNKTMAVSVETKSGFSTGKFALLFEGAYAAIDVAPDSQRFLMIKESENRLAPRVNVVIGVLDGLRPPAGEKTP